MYTTGAETITGAKTFSAQARIQSGVTSGTRMVGADVNVTTVTNGVRKLFRATTPAFNNGSVSPMFVFGADSQGTTIGHAVYLGAWEAHPA